LGLALVPNVMVPEAEQGCAGSKNLDPNFCPGQGGTSDLGLVNVTTRLPRTTSFYPPLMICRRIQWDNLNPNPQIFM